MAAQLDPAAKGGIHRCRQIGDQPVPLAPDLAEIIGHQHAPAVHQPQGQIRLAGARPAAQQHARARDSDAAGMDLDAGRSPSLIARRALASPVRSRERM